MIKVLNDVSMDNQSEPLHCNVADICLFCDTGKGDDCTSCDTIDFCRKVDS